jgi:hypothetical protein
LPGLPPQGGAEDPMIQRSGLRFIGTICASDKRRDPCASLLYGDTMRLPPLLIQVGTFIRKQKD